MENAYQLSIPLTTEARWGTNWEEMQPVEKAFMTAISTIAPRHSGE